MRCGVFAREQVWKSVHVGQYLPPVGLLLLVERHERRHGVAQGDTGGVL